MPAAAWHAAGMATLDASAAALLEMSRRADAPPVSEVGPEQARRDYVAATPEVCGPAPEVASVHDEVVRDGSVLSGAGGGVLVRVYRPDAAVGTVVLAHGGGWVLGDLDTHDVLCRSLALAAGAAVVAVDYALSPESRHPVAAGQLATVVRAAAGATLPGLPDGPVALAGDSAGGHLVGLAAALVAGEVPVAAVALLYPVVGPALDTPSVTENGDGYLLDADGMRWFWEQYAGAGALGAEARTASDGERVATDALPLDLRDTELGAWPSTLVLTAGFDPLRDEALALADALEAAGRDVRRLPFPGQVHGFLRWRPHVPEATTAVDAVGAWLADRLRATPSAPVEDEPQKR